MASPARLLAVLGATLLTACGAAREAQPIPGTARVSGKELVGLDALVGVTPVEGNAVSVLNNGQVFDAIVDDIAKAEHSVHISVFIWRPSAPSDRVLEALRHRRAGVKCRVLVEGITSPKFEEQVRPELEQLGCEARYHLPLRASKDFAQFADQFLERNHQKLVIVDGRLGITGGFGIWKSWEGDGRSLDHWRDIGVQVRGPVVRQMQLAFADNWRISGGGPLDPADLPEIAPAGKTRAAFVASEKGPRNAALALTHALIAGARHRIWIANSYFIPSDELIASMVERAQAGVDVRVLGPGDRHDLPPLLSAARATYPPLREGGVRIWEYAPAMMHSKVMLVDGQIAVIGSTNLDPFSLEQLDDGSLVVESPALVAQLERDFSSDLGWAREILRPRTTLAQLFTRRLFWFLGRNL